MALSLAIGNKMKTLAGNVANNAFQRFGGNATPGVGTIPPPMENIKSAIPAAADAAAGTVTDGQDTGVGPVQTALGGVAGNVANNLYQRWGAGNPGQNIFERAAAQRLDQVGDRVENRVNNFNGTVIGDMAQNRLDNINSRYKDKFGVERNAAEAPAPPATPDNPLPGIIDYNFKPGSTTGEIMSDSVDALKKAQEGNELTNTADDQLQKALNGELTDAGSEWYKNRSKQLDEAAADTTKNTIDALSWNGQTGSGVEGRAIADIQTRLAGDKAAALADSQDKYSLAAINRAGQKEQNAVNLGNLAINQDSADVNADLGYKKNARDWVDTGTNLWDTVSKNRMLKLNNLPGRYMSNMMNYANSLG